MDESLGRTHADLKWAKGLTSSAVVGRCNEKRKVGLACEGRAAPQDNDKLVMSRYNASHPIRQIQRDQVHIAALHERRR